VQHETLQLTAKQTSCCTTCVVVSTRMLGLNDVEFWFKKDEKRLKQNKKQVVSASQQWPNKTN
jgi:hypothetical protein